MGILHYDHEPGFSTQICWLRYLPISMIKYHDQENLLKATLNLGAHGSTVLKSWEILFSGV